ncbi:MAG TPA: DUF4019 domain-containing protein [Pyrinomonadaceae bacterium]|jgi:hypothetical protein|nr:DUF4019 domain-containing protein [Pyrinomonadaceae bacterium]
MSAPGLVRQRVALLSTATAILVLSLACGVEQKQSGLPSGAQSAIDNITSDLARGDHEKIYTEAAEEWRQTASADESRAHLQRIRNALGQVLSRAQLSAQVSEQDNIDSTRSSRTQRTLVVGYNTKFERADAIETFTLIERQGRWLLARYAVNSNALK